MFADLGERVLFYKRTIRRENDIKVRINDKNALNIFENHKNIRKMYFKR